MIKMDNVDFMKGMGNKLKEAFFELFRRVYCKRNLSCMLCSASQTGRSSSSICSSISSLVEGSTRWVSGELICKSVKTGNLRVEHLLFSFPHLQESIRVTRQSVATETLADYCRITVVHVCVCARTRLFWGFSSYLRC